MCYGSLLAEVNLGVLSSPQRTERNFAGS